MYRRRHRVALLLLVIIAGLLPAAALVFTAPARADAVKVSRPPLIVVVSQGETLWDLALAHTPPGQDPLAYLAEVIALNGVQATALQPGMALRLP